MSAKKMAVAVGLATLLFACSNGPGPGGGFCGDGFCSGESCSTCPGDCGACTGACSPANCAGCCSFGVCQGGTSADACGVGGNTCNVCGAGAECSGGTCRVAAESRWNLVIDYLDVPSVHHSGAAWDAFGGAPDPYIRVYIGSSTTPSIQNGPDDVFTINYDGSAVATNVRASDLWAGLQFEVYDEDTTDFEFVGACSLVVSDSQFSGARQTVACPLNPGLDSSGFTLDFHLTPF